MAETGELGTSIDDLVAAVGYWRAILERANAEIAGAERVLQEEHAQAYEQRELAKQFLTENEQQLRAAAVNLWNENGTQPHKAITIRQIKQPDYDLGAALAWAIRNAPQLLKLDEPRFKKEGPRLGAPIVFIEVPTAAIATNLAAWTAPLGDGC